MFLDRNTAKHFKAMLGETASGKYQPMSADPTTHFLVTMEPSHYEIHRQRAFVAQYTLLLTNTAASANDHLVEINWYEHSSKGA